MASASMAHTYGNITTFVNHWLLDLFPKNYFKTNYINSTIAYRDFATYNNNRKEFIKKQKPMLLIRPRIEIDTQDELPINQTYLANRIYDVMNDDIDTGNLQTFFDDRDNKRYIQFLLNSLRIVYDVSIVVETLMEQINLVHYFKNRVRQGYDMTVIAYLESFISRDIMYLLAKDAGFEDVFLKNPEERKHTMGDFLSYVNNNSLYPVTVKYKNSSGRHEFFRFHPTYVNMAITNLSIDEPSKKNQVVEESVISFSLRCDFNTAGMYLYLSNNDAIFEPDVNTPSMDNPVKDDMVPIVTPQNIYSNRTLPNGWQIFTTPAFNIDSDERPYPLDFSVLLNTSLNEAVNYHIKNGIPLTTFMDIEILKNNRSMELEKGEYEIDWNNLTVYIHNCDIVQEYRFILSVNTLYLNELLAYIVKFKEER
jgi:hypothetical protein